MNVRESLFLTNRLLQLLLRIVGTLEKVEMRKSLFSEFADVCGKTASTIYEAREKSESG
jgi:hypothetical protein